MSPRSTLRLREVKHVDPARGTEPIVEVIRDGIVVATIYGSREGVHIVSERFNGELRGDWANTPFFLKPGTLPPGYVVPLLDKGEICPWCEGRGEIPYGMEIRLCPVCHPLTKKPAAGSPI